LELGDLPEAKDAAQEVHILTESAGFSPLLAPALRNLGTIAHRQGDPSTARQLWQQALAIFETIESPHAETVRGWLNDNE
jgi:tetratricopeptide (TPR) repeat protein